MVSSANAAAVLEIKKDQNSKKLDQTVQTTVFHDLQCPPLQATKIFRFFDLAVTAAVNKPARLRLRMRHSRLSQINVVFRFVYDFFVLFSAVEVNLNP